jgi:alpha-beta hydrolase superfamily lysophospholipase
VLQVLAQDAVAGTVAEFAGGLLPAAAPARTELVEARLADGTALAGYLHVPQPPTDLAVLVVHGMAQGPFSPMAARFTPAWLDAGFTVLAIETRRTGMGGVIASVPETEVDDIDAFVALLAERGMRIVLVGASLGSQAVSRYLAGRPHPAVLAAVHLAPTDDCPDWARRAVGDVEYERCVAEARAAVAAGSPEALVVADFRMPPPARFGPTLRLRETARSWLAWWGPDADTVHTRLIAEAPVPLLLLSGSEDDHNTPERMDTLQKAATRAPVVEQRWYEDCDHDFGRFEHAAVADVAAWLDGLGIRPGQAQA